MGASGRMYLEQQEEFEFKGIMDNSKNGEPSDIRAYAENIVQKVHDGYLNPLFAFERLQQAAKHFQAAKKMILEEAITEFEKYGQKEVSMNGVVFRKKNSAGKWDFSDIDEWNEAEQTLEGIQEAAKNAYISSQKGGFVFNEHGEQIQSAKYIPGSETLSEVKQPKK